MKKIFYLITFLFLPIFVALPQGQFNFNVDYASFKYDSTSNYVEFYYSFPEEQLTRIKKDGKNIIEGLLQIRIINTTSNKDFLNKKWRIPSIAPKITGKAKARNLTGMIAFVIPKGNYTCTAKGSDNNNLSQTKDYTFSFHVIPYASSKLKISDVQLASNIKNDGVDKKSIFYKNTLEVIPYPTDIYGKTAPVVFYYGEVYNLDKATDFNNLIFETSVMNNDNKKMYLKKDKIGKKSPSIVKVGAINVSKYPTGKYDLILSLADSIKNFGIISSKEFFVYNPDVKKKTSNAKNTGKLLSSQFAVLSDAESNHIWDASEYIATQNEKDQWDKIHTVKGKREYLFKFWNKRDKDKNTQKNEYYTEYFKRVNTASRKYKNLAKDGSKTDMGRVFIMYGAPDQIERFPNQKNTKPYEIWTYQQIEGGVIFVFADITGFSNYILVHSTKRNEYHDSSWLSRISTR
ncbi:MAG TPA: GWxTD domain-containing protein [Ignavibacteria bacterium]|nr:GWxTD domain-containing protein [Ignavibacteria bacterium]